MEGTWTITELAEHAVTALAADGSPRINGRVRDLPNERLIRWYTTIGLVDPPLGRRGRTALYGHRHLLQLVAIKRRQALGRTIAEIQAELTGATDSTLEEIARMAPSPDAPPAPPAPPGERTSAPAPERERFWAARPVPPDEPRVAEGPSVVQGVRLSPDLTLLLNVSSLDGDDLAAIQAAARPLLEELRRRGLTGPDLVPPTAYDSHDPAAEPPGRSS